MESSGPIRNIRSRHEEGEALSDFSPLFSELRFYSVGGMGVIRRANWRVIHAASFQKIGNVTHCLKHAHHSLGACKRIATGIGYRVRSDRQIPQSRLSERLQVPAKGRHGLHQGLEGASVSPKELLAIQKLVAAGMEVRIAEQLANPARSVCDQPKTWRGTQFRAKSDICDLSWPKMPIRQAARRYNGLSCDCQ
jgi:hypothetical protein